MQRHRIPLAVLSALSLTLAACSGSNDDAQVASLTGDAAADEATDGETVDPDEAFLEYAECMRDHDIPMEDPGAGGGFVSGSVEEDAGEATVNINGVEVDPEVFDAAQQACEPLLEDAIGDRQIDPAEVAEMQDQMYEFGECMRDHGVDWEDPVVSADGGRVTMQNDGGPNSGNAAAVEDPEVQAAMEECSRSVGGGTFGDGGIRIGGPDGPEGRDDD